uniref:PGG domain-containing protein n=1 Tax=Oryza meridionalis TaxID=40149 RepID=A0A0E0FAL5_9ORYZ
MERAQPEPAPIAAAPGHEPITAAGAESQPAADAHAVLECPAALDHPAASIDAAALPPPRMPKHLYLAVFNGEKANVIKMLQLGNNGAPRGEGQATDGVSDAQPQTIDGAPRGEDGEGQATTTDGVSHAQPQTIDGAPRAEDQTVDDVPIAEDAIDEEDRGAQNIHRHFVRHRVPIARTEQYESRIDAVTAEGNTVLHIAASRGHAHAPLPDGVNQQQEDLITVLYNARWCLLSSLNSEGETPLHYAARAGHAHAVQRIIAGVMAMSGHLVENQLTDIIARRNYAGENALHLAAMHGHAQVVTTLLENAPNARLSSALTESNNASALYLAVMSKSVATVEAVLADNDASAQEMVNKVLEGKPELASGVDDMKSTPLHFASPMSKSLFGDDPASPERQLQWAQSLVSMQDSEGSTALHIAALMGHDNVVRLLVETSPDSADIRDKDGRTFLHIACADDKEWQQPTARYVVKNPILHGLLNSQDKEGNTPLHLAANHGEYATVYNLISSGKVHPDIMNAKGETAFDIAKNTVNFFVLVSTVLTMSKYKACFAPRRQDHVTEWRSKDKKKWRDNTSKNLIMVSALVATLAFAAIFDVPSTITGDDEAKLTSNTMYNAYIMLLTGAVLTSVAATLLLIYARTSESRGSWLCFMLSFHLVWISLICLINASLAAVAAVVTKQYFVEWIFNVGMYILIMVFTSLVTPAPLFLTRLRKFVFNMVPRRSRLAISRRYPMTTRFVLNVLFFLAINIVAHAICVFVSLMVP